MDVSRRDDTILRQRDGVEEGYPSRQGQLPMARQHVLLRYVHLARLYPLCMTC